MNKILFITILILLVGTVSAYYSGETLILNNTIGENVVWTIIENTTEITILPNVEINSENITITFPADMPPNNFKIVFLEEQTKEVVKTVTVSSGGGGGSSSTKYVTEYKEVPNYVTQYVNQTIEKEVPKEVEVIKNKTSLWAYVVLGLFVVSFLYIIFKTKESSKENIVERRLENE